jgi:hypothetical protein
MHNYFTITAGRTGSAWLASFLAANLGIEAIHEPMAIDDFGVRMPDIRTMRTFNTRGNNEFVREFWVRKFASIPSEGYAETNHTLCKCGLVENVILHGREDITRLVLLKRGIVKQCTSYIIRGDFNNITLMWQWYLDHSYPKKLVDPKSFAVLGGIGIPLWYCYEMAARQEYYRRKFSDRIRMVTVDLEEVTTEAGAQALLEALGHEGPCVLPAPRNEIRTAPPPALVASIEEAVARLRVDMDALVDQAIRRGFGF